MDFAFDFIIQNGGLDTEDDYPYSAQVGATPLVCTAYRSTPLSPHAAHGCACKRP